MEGKEPEEPQNQSNLMQPHALERKVDNRQCSKKFFTKNISNSSIFGWWLNEDPEALCSHQLNWYRIEPNRKSIAAKRRQNVDRNREQHSTLNSFIDCNESLRLIGSFWSAAFQFLPTPAFFFRLLLLRNIGLAELYASCLEFHVNRNNNSKKTRSRSTLDVLFFSLSPNRVWMWNAETS